MMKFILLYEKRINGKEDVRETLWDFIDNVCHYYVNYDENGDIDENDYWIRNGELSDTMGLRFPATIEFDLMDLGNEEAIRTLYLNMADRNMLSDEMMQKLVKVDPKMEKIRLNRESRDRKAGRMVRKDGPFVEPDADPGDPKRKSEKAKLG
jgi:hypothetical protein